MTIVKKYLGRSQTDWLECFIFNFDTGDVYRNNGIPVGRYDKTRGYYRFGYKLNGNKYETALHRLVFFAYHGWIDDSLVIDHIDGCSSNNSISNLRLVTVKENAANSKYSRGGLVGARKYKDKWEAVVVKNAKLLHYEIFDTEQEAHESYLNFKKQQKSS